MEMDREEKKLHNQLLKDEDLNEYRNAKNLQASSKNPTAGQSHANSTTPIDSSAIYKNDKVLQKLRDNLMQASGEAVNLPYDICNVLKAEID